MDHQVKIRLEMDEEDWVRKRGHLQLYIRTYIPGPRNKSREKRSPQHNNIIFFSRRGARKRRERERDRERKKMMKLGN